MSELSQAKDSRAVRSADYRFYVGATHAHANTGCRFLTEAEAVEWAEQMRTAGWTVWISVSGYVEGYEYPGVQPRPKVAT